MTVDYLVGYEACGGLDRISAAPPRLHGISTRHPAAGPRLVSTDSPRDLLLPAQASVAVVLAKRFRPVRAGAAPLGFPAYDAEKKLVGLYREQVRWAARDMLPKFRRGLEGHFLRLEGRCLRLEGRFPRLDGVGVPSPTRIPARGAAATSRGLAVTSRGATAILPPLATAFELSRSVSSRCRRGAAAIPPPLSSSRGPSPRGAAAIPSPRSTRTIRPLGRSTRHPAAGPRPAPTQASTPGDPNTKIVFVPVADADLRAGDADAAEKAYAHEVGAKSACVHTLASLGTIDALKEAAFVYSWSKEPFAELAGFD